MMCARLWRLLESKHDKHSDGLPHFWIRLFEMFLLSVLLRYWHITLYFVCLFFLLVFFYMGADGSGLSEWEMEKWHFEWNVVSVEVP